MLPVLHIGEFGQFLDVLLVWPDGDALLNQLHLSLQVTEAPHVEWTSLLCLPAFASHVADELLHFQLIANQK